MLIKCPFYARNHVCIVSSNLLNLCVEMVVFIVLILHMRKPELKEVKKHTQGCPAS